MEIGFALLKNNKIIKMQKGLKLDVRDIAKEIKNTDYDWALFHTRLASVGDKLDKNCHPFKRKDILMAMNGTEHSVDFISSTKEMTDTEAIIDILDKYNLGITALRRFSSIFMGFYKSKPFVVADNTHNIEILYNKKNNAKVFASSFPNSFKKNIFEPNKCFSWYDGKMPNNLVKKKIRYMRYKDLYYYDDFYGQYIWNLNYFEGEDDYEKAV